ncbi:LytR/AlgR family response regulator transcription factor [Taibaiella koreensis]|uniref:LytR/AlgR family response regulator transcription factor n=1 Tax=Taibaiella koreensis TaxID=1268548 RepID=UPI0013C2FCD9|nr:LytTR family DNA-binding domain-containing protein [Taibaiella koreensis]
MLTTLIIDDEENSRITLRNFVARYCPGVTIVADVPSVAAALPAIEQHVPQLVLLDIDMPIENGFTLFERIPKPGFHTVFVTAYDTYALQAIKQHAFDYLLKPVNIDELIHTVNRVRLLCEQQVKAQRYDKLLSSLQPPATRSRIGLPTAQGYEYVPVADIIRCEAEGCYTIFYFVTGKKMIVCRTLGFFEGILNEYNFQRIHHRHLINIEHVQQYERGRGGTVTMSDKQQIPVSQRKRDDFLNALKSM